MKLFDSSTANFYRAAGAEPRSSRDFHSERNEGCDQAEAMKFSSVLFRVSPFERSGDTLSIPLVPDDIDAVRAFAGGGSTQFPIGRDLVFHRQFAPVRDVQEVPIEYARRFVFYLESGRP